MFFGSLNVNNLSISWYEPCLFLRSFTFTTMNNLMMMMILTMILFGMERSVIPSQFFESFGLPFFGIFMTQWFHSFDMMFLSQMSWKITVKLWLLEIDLLRTILHLSCHIQELLHFKSLYCKDNSLNLWWFNDDV